MNANEMVIVRLMTLVPLCENILDIGEMRRIYPATTVMIGYNSFNCAIPSRMRGKQNSNKVTKEPK